MSILFRHSHANALLACLVAISLAVSANSPSLGQSAPTQARPDTQGLINIALELERAGKFGEAERAYKDALVTLENAYGPNSGAVASTLVLQAVFLRNRGMLEAAWEAAQRSVKLHSEALGRFDPRTVQLYYILGSIATKQNKAREAETQYRLFLEALDLMSPQKAQGLPGASAAQELGALLYKRGAAAEAEIALKRSLRYSAALSPRDNSSIGRTHYSLGVLYQSRRRNAEAEASYREAVANLRPDQGKDDVNFRYALGQLGITRHFLGRYQDAEAPLKEAIALQEKFEKHNELRLAELFVILGTNHRMQRRFAEGEPLLQKAVAIREAQLKPGDPLIADALFSLGALMRWQQRYAEAESLFRRSFAIREAARGVDSREGRSNRTEVVWRRRCSQSSSTDRGGKSEGTDRRT
jgi:tetratricopeptide (TPR) repeat protein